MPAPGALRSPAYGWERLTQECLCPWESLVWGRVLLPISSVTRVVSGPWLSQPTARLAFSYQTSWPFSRPSAPQPCPPALAWGWGRWAWRPLRHPPPPPLPVSPPNRLQGRVAGEAEQPPPPGHGQGQAAPPHCPPSLARALDFGYLTQDMIDDYEPALMFTIPRLAIVW